MKRNLVDLLEIIATHQMRPAEERDNPFFFGPGVYAIDLGDDLLMFGKDSENPGLGIYYQTMDGCQDYHLDVELTLDELGEQLEIIDGVVATVDRQEQTIELDGIVYDVCHTGNVVYAQVDGQDVASVTWSTGMWVGEIVGSDLYQVLGFEIYSLTGDR